MSRSKNISIDRIKFEAAINEIMKTRHFSSWSDICADMVVNKDLLRSAARKEQISAKTAKMLEKFYGVKLEDYTPAIEGIFEEQEEVADLADQIARGIKIALDDVQNRNILRGIIASGIVAALEAQKGAKA